MNGKGIDLFLFNHLILGDPKFGGYLYDGDNCLYLTHRLDKEIMNLTVESREGVSYKILIRNVGRKIAMSDQAGTQVLNLILRRAMDGLQMQLVGRNLYDPGSKVSTS